jgi:hypothetical protein
MALRSCVVSCRDLAGIEHAVEVTTESLYVAGAQALGILLGNNLGRGDRRGLTELKVCIRQAAVVLTARCQKPRITPLRGRDDKIVACDDFLVCVAGQLRAALY